MSNETKPVAWAHRYSPRGLLHYIRDSEEEAAADVALVGGSAEVVPLYDQSALDAAVAAERERMSEVEAALETLVNRCNTDFVLATDDAVIAAEAALERLHKYRTARKA